MRTVTVTGEVNFPGPYALEEGRDRVSTALARSGGLSPWAARDRIQVLRLPRESEGHRDAELERLSRLSRSEMTDADYEAVKQMQSDPGNRGRSMFDREIKLFVRGVS